LHDGQRLVSEQNCFHAFRLKDNVSKQKLLSESPRFKSLQDVQALGFVHIIDAQHPCS
jgi:hypothetical protein